MPKKSFQENKEGATAEESVVKMCTLQLEESAAPDIERRVAMAKRTGDTEKKVLKKSEAKIADASAASPAVGAFSAEKLKEDLRKKKAVATAAKSFGPQAAMKEPPKKAEAVIISFISVDLEKVLKRSDQNVAAAESAEANGLITKQDGRQFHAERLARASHAKAKTFSSNNNHGDNNAESNGDSRFGSLYKVAENHFSSIDGEKYIGVMAIARLFDNFYLVKAAYKASNATNVIKHASETAKNERIFFMQPFYFIDSDTWYTGQVTNIANGALTVAQLISLETYSQKNACGIKCSKLPEALGTALLKMVKSHGMLDEKLPETYADYIMVICGFEYLKLLENEAESKPDLVAYYVKAFFQPLYKSLSHVFKEHQEIYTDSRFALLLKTFYGFVCLNTNKGKTKLLLAEIHADMKCNNPDMDHKGHELAQDYFLRELVKSDGGDTNDTATT